MKANASFIELCDPDCFVIIDSTNLLPHDLRKTFVQEKIKHVLAF